jgi:hypothetical protein
LHLRRGNSDQLLTAVPDGALPESARGVQVLVSIRIPNATAPPAYDDDRGLRLTQDLMRMDDVRLIESL